MTNALDNLMNQADQAAQNFQAPVVQQQAAVPAAYAKPSLDSMIDGGGMSVDAYFRLKSDGFKIGDEMGSLLDELVVTIDMSEIAPIKSARFEVGGNTTFIKSYDGVTTSTGENFAQVVAARSAQPGVKASGVYDSAEIPVTLTETVVDTKRGSSVSFPAGTRVGYTPSVTGFNPFRTFLKKLRAQNPDLLTSVITVKLVHEKKVNANKNEWGVLNFEFLGEAE